MEDELRLSLLVAGTCFIIAVLAHGIWKIRKNSDPDSKPRVEPKPWGDNDNNNADGEGSGSSQGGFDELGIGQVRVVKSPVIDSGDDLGDSPDPQQSSGNETVSATSSDTEYRQKMDASEAPVFGDINSIGGEDNDTDDTDLRHSNASLTQHITGEPSEEAHNTAASSEDEKTPEKPKLYGSVVSNPKPHMQGQQTGLGDGTGKMPTEFPEPPGFLLKDHETTEAAPLSTSADMPSAEGEQKAPDSVNQQAHTVSSPEIDEFSLHAPATAERKTTAENLTPEPEKINTAGEAAKRSFKTKRSKSAPRKRQEPKFGDDQMRIDFDESQMDARSSQNATPEKSEDNPEGQVEQEVLVLNVRAPEDDAIAGAALLPMLLTLGFKFGDQNIFHRHVNSNGKGPVLFSLANMFKPGVFDIDSLETFSTQGISLFMILPIEGDPHQVFNMMHNAARKLADEFNAQVLDGRRSVLTKQGLQQYMEKIREFERKRIIARQ